MQYLSAYLALLAATSISAVPLNINLGAYSPALVVGDGEISFGGAESAEALVNTLAGASAGTQNAEAALANAVTQKGTAEVVPTIVAPAAEAAASASTLPSGAFGIGKKVVEPREPDNADTGVEKRDLAGFNAALKFATGALTKGPTVELGTGEGGSGVGITVKPGAVARSEESAVEKRQEGSLPTVTLLKIRSLGGSNRAARKARRGNDVVEREVEIDSADSVNLNLDGDFEFEIAEVKP